MSKGIGELLAQKDVLLAGCYDGTIRSFSKDLQHQEILQTVEGPVSALAVYGEQTYLIGVASTNQLVILSKEEKKEVLTEKQQFMREIRKP